MGHGGAGHAVGGCIEGLCICFYIIVKSFAALILIAAEFCEETNEFQTTYSSKFLLTSDNMRQFKICWAVIAILLMVILIPLLIMAFINESSIRYYLIFPLIFLFTINFIRFVFYFGRQQEEMLVQQELPKKILNNQIQKNLDITVVSVPQQYIVEPNKTYTTYPQVYR